MADKINTMNKANDTLNRKDKIDLSEDDILIQEADQLLQKAKEEVERAEEDFLAFVVCVNSRQAIKNYLSSYLISNKIEIENPATMHSLIEQCRNEDGRFQLLDISGIHCNHDETDEAYCMNGSKVKECLEVASLTKNIVKNDSPTH